MTMIGELEQGDGAVAVEEAVTAGDLSRDSNHDNHVDLFTYVGTHPTAGHAFKHRASGRVTFGPKPPPPGNSLLHLVAARERVRDAVKCLQDALRAAGAVESIAMLPLIETAAKLAMDIAVLAGAFEADAKDAPQPMSTALTKAIRTARPCDTDGSEPS